MSGRINKPDSHTVLDGQTQFLISGELISTLKQDKTSIQLYVQSNYTFLAEQLMPLLEKIGTTKNYGVNINFNLPDSVLNGFSHQDLIKQLVTESVAITNGQPIILFSNYRINAFKFKNVKLYRVIFNDQDDTSLVLNEKNYKEFIKNNNIKALNNGNELFSQLSLIVSQLALNGFESESLVNLIQTCFQRIYNTDQYQKIINNRMSFTQVIAKLKQSYSNSIGLMEKELFQLIFDSLIYHAKEYGDIKNISAILTGNEEITNVDDQNQVAGADEDISTEHSQEPIKLEDMKDYDDITLMFIDRNSDILKPILADFIKARGKISYENILKELSKYDFSTHLEGFETINKDVFVKYFIPTLFDSAYSDPVILDGEKFCRFFELDGEIFYLVYAEGEDGEKSKGMIYTHKQFIKIHNKPIYAGEEECIDFIQENLQKFQGIIASLIESKGIISYNDLNDLLCDIDFTQHGFDFEDITSTNLLSKLLAVCFDAYDEPNPNMYESKNVYVINVESKKYIYLNDITDDSHIFLIEDKLTEFGIKGLEINESDFLPFSNDTSVLLETLRVHRFSLGNMLLNNLEQQEFISLDLDNIDFEDVFGISLTREQNNLIANYLVNFLISDTYSQPVNIFDSRKVFEIDFNGNKAYLLEIGTNKLLVDHEFYEDFIETYDYDLTYSFKDCIEEIRNRIINLKVAGITETEIINEIKSAGELDFFGSKMNIRIGARTLDECITALEMLNENNDKIMVYHKVLLENILNRLDSYIQGY